jgi:threonine dehydrogenase-like Zn-dependent dehydrogenase
MMLNPWLDVPLDDYEGHMRSAGVEQLGVLSELFAEALATCRPTSVAILGIAGGNGLEAVDPTITRRVVGVDINPRYLDATRRRFPFIRGLDLRCMDLASEAIDLEPVNLVHAALIFEHAGTARCLENASAMMAPAGHLSVVLQLPGDIEHRIGSSKFVSVQKLGSDFSLVNREMFIGVLAARHCRLVKECTRQLPAGKAFWMGIFGQARGSPECW